MHKLNDEMYAEITRIIEDKIDMNEKVNKYDVLKEARENLGQTVRYRDVRDQIDEIIRYVAKERGKCWSSEYVRTSDGKVYREYTFYFDDFSDEYENEPDDDSDEYEASIDEDGIEGVILGCTEIEMLIKDGDVSIPLYDTTQAHIDSLVHFIVEER